MSMNENIGLRLNLLSPIKDKLVSIFEFSVHKVSIYSNFAVVRGKYVNQWARLYSNKTLFTKQAVD